MSTGQSDSSDLAAVKAPKGWTENVVDIKRVQNMLASSIGREDSSIKDIIRKERANDEYVFSSGGDFYFWNCASGDGALVLKPKGKDALWKQMDTDIMKVQVKDLDL